MAGDWIKMRADLFTHPKVVRISSALKADTLRTVGGLMSVWCLFDAHSEDGRLSGYESQTLDDHLRWPGFAAAMQAVQWLVVVDGEGLELPRFEAHNGQSAKRRAQEADRKRDARKTSASDADTKRTREEKRREEVKSNESSNDDSSGIVETEDGKICRLVKACYHEALPNCRRAEADTPKRTRKILAAHNMARRACKANGWTMTAEQFWRAYFDECAEDPWMRGDLPNPSNPRWKQNLFTLIDDERFGQIMDRAISAVRETQEQADAH